jgi:hypothetical protein
MSIKSLNMNVSFVAALSIITKIEKPRCLSIGEWINKLWYIQIMKKEMSYQAIKRHGQTPNAYSQVK